MLHDQLFNSHRNVVNQSSTAHLAREEPLAYFCPVEQKHRSGTQFALPFHSTNPFDLSRANVLYSVQRSSQLRRLTDTFRELKFRNYRKGDLSVQANGWQVQKNVLRPQDYCRFMRRPTIRSRNGMRIVGCRSSPDMNIEEYVRRNFSVDDINDQGQMTKLPKYYRRYFGTLKASDGPSKREIASCDDNVPSLTRHEKTVRWVLSLTR